jgi:Domain of unknown function (DUF5925)/ATPase family associated with various cellular activities (AAA)
MRQKHALAGMLRPMADLGPRFRAAVDLEHEGPAAAFFLARVLDDGLREVRSDRWATSERSLSPLGQPLFRSSGAHHETVILERGEVLLQVTLGSGYVHAEAAADDDAAVRGAFAELRAVLPAPEPVARHDVPVTFWTYTPQGPMPSVRPIAVPEWPEIAANYAAETRERLGGIMSAFRPAHGGQLILWHGEAGTGKTFALRALAWEWREWCQIHYIVDPDTFFGERADYLMGVLMQPDEMSMGIQMMRSYHGFSPAVFHLDSADVDEGEEEGETPKHWRLLVLEDTGELLTPDAKSIIGQGLSRFLNVVDGLIGQGLRVLVLVTTNEELRRLHPAVARPGRCAANVHFTPLSGDEADEWLHDHGVDGGAGGRRTVASLYAQLEGLDPATAGSARFGFRE